MADVIPKETDRDGVKLLMRRGAQLVDVLPREEYDQLHIAGATSIPLSMISRHTADRLKWDKPVILYSRDAQCDLSARAAWRLSSLGFTQIFRYTVGKADWLANGLPVEGSEAGLETVADIVDMEVPTCKRGERVGDVRQRVTSEGWNTCVVVNDNMIVLGILQAIDLEKGDPTWPAEEVMQRDPLAFRLDVRLVQALEQMKQQRLENALVTTTDGRLFGLLKLEDLRRA